MSKYDAWIKSYKIYRPIGGLYRWGAKGVIYKNSREIETEEFWGRTKEEAEEKAKRKVEEMIEKGGEKNEQ